MTFFRNDIKFSSLYAATEDVFISIANGEGDKSTERVYKMNKLEKDLTDNFMYVKNNGLLLNKTNVDKNGKASITDPATGRPIIIGQGLLPQIEEFASKYVYNKMTTAVMNAVLNLGVEKADKDASNEFLFVINSKLWTDINTTLGSWLLNQKIVSGNVLWSKDPSEGYVQVGATYNAYEFAGNKVIFKVDRAFTREFGNKGFGLLLDLTTDKASGKSPIDLYTLKGADMIVNTLDGVGK